jgi:hypothetical protein
VNFHIPDRAETRWLSSAERREKLRADKITDLRKMEQHELCVNQWPVLSQRMDDIVLLWHLELSSLDFELYSDRDEPNQS